MPRGSKSGISSAATNVSGKSTMHPTLGMTWKRALKIERIARLSADPAGFSNEQIANMLNCDKQTIVLIRQSPEYHAKMIEISTGVVSMYDQQLRENVDNMRDELRSMVPSSMMVIRNAICGRYGHQQQVKCALEVMDREGTLAKVSKTSVSITDKPDISINPQVASNLMALLSSAPTTSDSEIAAGQFTVNAAEAAIQQVEMGETNTSKTLESFDSLDLSKSKPN